MAMRSNYQKQMGKMAMPMLGKKKVKKKVKKKKMKKGY